MKSTKKIKLFIPIAFIAFVLLFACENPWMAEILQEKTITFNSNGGSSVPSQKLFAGERVKRPADPVWEGQIFEGWYKDNRTFEEPYDFDYIPVNSMTLYAKWREATPEDMIIKSVDVKISGPATGETQVTEYPEGGTGYSCGLVTWSPDDSIFEKNTIYTASVTLTAIGDYIFSNSLAAKINGIGAEKSNQSETSITLSHTFAKTDSKTVKEISIENQPVLTVYTYGQNLNLAGLKVRLTYDDDSYSIAELADLESRNIFTSPQDNTPLSISHNGHPVEISFGSRLKAYTTVLTVGKATPTEGDFDIIGNWSQTKSSVVPIQITGKAGKTTGTITVNYRKENELFVGNGIKNAPIGIYTVTFNVAGDDNWNEAQGLYAGELVIVSVSAAALTVELNKIKIQPNNSSSNTIKLVIKDVEDFKDIKSVLDNYPEIYVTLDLSDSTIDRIPDNAFFTVIGTSSTRTETLAGIILPSNVKSIGDDAFCGCINLASVTMPNSVQSIGENAFRATNLTSVIIPDSVTSIGQEAFASCPLTSIIIPKSVTTIGEWAFDNCTSLTSVEFKGGNTEFDEYTFGSGNNYNNLLARYLEGGAGTYTRASGSTLWKPEIFKSIDALKSWLEDQPTNGADDALPYTVKLNINDLSLITEQIKTTINDHIFQINYGDKGVEVVRKVNLDFSGSTFTTFPEDFFSSCAWLTGITIPSSVTSILKCAFFNCGLNSVTFLGTISSNNFNNEAFKNCGYLRDKFYEENAINGMPGTYTTTAPVNEYSKWTIQP